MAIGDKSAQSYGWHATLAEAVPDGGGVTFPAPGFDEQYTDTRYAEVSVSSFNAVWRTGEGKAEIVFATTEPYSVTVTNNSGAEWPQGSDLYVFCPHLLSEGHNQYDLKGQIWDLQQRVSALEGAARALEPPEEEPEEEPAPERHAKKGSKRK
jgi:hypothetical protein